MFFSKLWIEQSSLKLKNPFAVEFGLQKLWTGCFFQKLWIEQSSFKYKNPLAREFGLQKLWAEGPSFFKIYGLNNPVLNAKISWLENLESKRTVESISFENIWTEQPSLKCKNPLAGEFGIQKLWIGVFIFVKNRSCCCFLGLFFWQILEQKYKKIIYAWIKF